MIIGNGLIACEFKKNIEHYQDVCVFAAGVSDSNCNLLEEYEREEILLKQYINQNPIVYFNSIYAAYATQDKKYYSHKKRMTDLVLKNSGIVFNVPNIVGSGGNPNTFVNSIVQKIKDKQMIFVQSNVSRCFLDVADLEYCVRQFMSRHSQNYTLFGNVIDLNPPISYSIPECVKILSDHLGLEVKYKSVIGEDVPLPVSSFLQYLIEDVNINFNQNYLKEVILKYV